jgi:hypothetical protein
VPGSGAARWRKFYRREQRRRPPARLLPEDFDPEAID